MFWMQYRRKDNPKEYLQFNSVKNKNQNKKKNHNKKQNKLPKFHHLLGDCLQLRNHQKWRKWHCLKKECKSRWLLQTRFLTCIIMRRSILQNVKSWEKPWRPTIRKSLWWGCWSKHSQWLWENTREWTQPTLPSSTNSNTKFTIITTSVLLLIHQTVLSYQTSRMSKHLVY